MNMILNKCAYPYGQFGAGVTLQSEFGCQGFRGDELYSPQLCDVSNTGELVVADTENNRIQVFQAVLNTSTFSPYGGHGYGNGFLNHPKSAKFCTLPGANLIVSDSGNKRICLLNINFSYGKLEFVTSFGETQFSEPSDVAVDRRNGNITVTDAGTNRVSIHSSAGQFLTYLEERGFMFSRPSGVVITHDGKSDIFVSDTGNHCIRKFACDGKYVGVFGGYGDREGLFNSPRGIGIDRKGYIFVADEMNNRVQMFSPDLAYVTTAVSNIYAPKGIAAGEKLFVTTGDQKNFIKVYQGINS